MAPGWSRLKTRINDVGIFWGFREKYSTVKAIEATSIKSKIITNTAAPLRPEEVAGADESVISKLVLYQSKFSISLCGFYTTDGNFDISIVYTNVITKPFYKI